MPHAALWVVQLGYDPPVRNDWQFQCRTRLCGWCSQKWRFIMWNLKNVSMPHAALWVVQRD